MAARDFHQVTSLGETTGGASGVVTKVTFAFTPKANTTYMVMARFGLNPLTGLWAQAWLDVSDYTNVDIGQDPGTFGHTAFLARVDFAGGNFSDGQFVHIIKPHASPSEITWTLKFIGRNIGDTGSADATMREAVVFAVELGEHDQWASAEGLIAEGTSFSNAVSKTWTPDGEGDFLVLANASVFEPTTDGHDDGEFRIEHNGTGYHTARMKLNRDLGNADGGRTWCTAKRLTGLSGSQTVRIQARSMLSGSTNKVWMWSPMLVILRLDQFTEATVSEASSRTTTSSNTFTNHNFTGSVTVHGDYLLLGYGLIDEQAQPGFGSVGVEGRFWDDNDASAPNYNASTVKAQATLGNDKYIISGSFIKNHASSVNRNYRIQWRRADTFGTSAKGCSASLIAVLKLEFPPPQFSVVVPMAMGVDLSFVKPISVTVPMAMHILIGVQPTGGAVRLLGELRILGGTRIG